MLSTKKVLLDRVTQERSAVFYSIAFMPEDQLLLRPVIGEWSVKDVLGHLSAWEAEIIHGIEQFMHGDRPDLLDIADVDTWNGEQARQRWDRSLEDVKGELMSKRKRLLDLVSALPDEALARLGPPPCAHPFIPDMLNAIAEHDREHWAALAAYKATWVAAQQVQISDASGTVKELGDAGSRPPLLTR
jgi:DinB superfamily